VFGEHLLVAFGDGVFGERLLVAFGDGVFGERLLVALGPQRQSLTRRLRVAAACLFEQIELPWFFRCAIMK
jgi:hypothetical protein